MVSLQTANRPPRCGMRAVTSPSSHKISDTATQRQSEHLDPADTDTRPSEATLRLLQEQPRRTAKLATAIVWSCCAVRSGGSEEGVVVGGANS
jgi:hypothetical protein